MPDQSLKSKVAKYVVLMLKEKMTVLKKEYGCSHPYPFGFVSPLFDLTTQPTCACPVCRCEASVIA